MLTSLFITFIYLRIHGGFFWYILCCDGNGCRIVEHLMMWNHFYYHCSSERAQRSRQHERGTSAERRYKRSHRRSPTSSNHRRQHRHRHHGGHGSGHTHRGHRDLAEHSRRSYSSSQVSSLEKVSEAARTILPRGFLQQHKLCTSATTTANILYPFHWCRKSINVLFSFQLRLVYVCWDRIGKFIWLYLLVYILIGLMCWDFLWDKTYKDR